MPRRIRTDPQCGQVRSIEVLAHGGETRRHIQVDEAKGCLCDAYAWTRALKQLQEVRKWDNAKSDDVSEIDPLNANVLWRVISKVNEGCLVF
jgi:hypothetical protein